MRQRRWDTNIKAPESKRLGAETQTQTQEPLMEF